MYNGQMISIGIEKRDMKAGADAVRKTGKMPAVFYGPKEASTPVLVGMSEFRKVWKKAGESSVIILKDASNNEHEALIHEVDVHPLTGEPRHADFYVIEKGKKVQVAVPLIFEGVSPAVKDKAGILVKVRRDLEIEAAPRDLPHDVKVDISTLVELTDVVLAKDLVLPAGVDLKISPDEVIVSIAEAKEEIEEAPAAIDMSAIEVETKGKEVKEGEEGAAPATASGDKKPAEKKPESKK
ncbi:MAG: 50S ribosomal protein L25 [Candidatus Paceibacterota bacterium]|jgi:large subunit ribosomal protein L25